MAKKKESENFEGIKKQVVELLMVANGVDPSEFDSEFKILFVVEGHSASSGIRTKRNPKVHGVLALRGKIMNVWNADLSYAMRSDIIKEYFTVVKEEKYNYIVFTCDADPDGDHIRTLLLACTSKFLRDMVDEGKVLNCETPLYTFHDSKNKLVTWSKDNIEIKGLTKKENKGLGSYDYDSIEKLILYPQKGATYSKFELDKNYRPLMDEAMIRGCVSWVKIEEGA